MRVNRKLAGLLVLTLALSSVTACGSKDEGPTKEELQQQVDELTSQLTAAQSELQAEKISEQNIREVLAQYSPTAANVTDLSALTSLTYLDLTVSAYTSVDDVIRIDDTLDLAEESIGTVPNAIQVYVNDIGLNPGADWTFNSDNNIIRMLHKDGLHMNIETIKYYATVYPDEFQTTLVEPYMKRLRAEDVEYSKVFNSSGHVVGVIGKGTLYVKAYSDGTTEYDRPDFEPQYVVDEEGNQVLDEAGNLQQYILDEYGDILVDEEGNQVILETEAPAETEPNYERDADGNIVYETDASGELVAETDASGNIVYETDAEGNEIYETDASGETVYETDADGEQVLDEDGNPIPVRIEKHVPVIAEVVEEEPDYELQTYTYEIAVLYTKSADGIGEIVTIKSVFKNDGATESIQQTLVNTMLTNLDFNGTRLSLEAK